MQTSKKQRALFYNKSAWRGNSPTMWTWKRPQAVDQLEGSDGDELLKAPRGSEVAGDAKHDDTSRSHVNADLPIRAGYQRSPTRDRKVAHPRSG